MHRFNPCAEIGSRRRRPSIDAWHRGRSIQQLRRFVESRLGRRRRVEQQHRPRIKHRWRRFSMNLVRSHRVQRAAELRLGRILPNTVK